jgi:putative transposase
MMQKLSLTYTQHINKKYDRTGRLWESRFYASVIERDPHLWTVCRYIERNPVRAEIADSPECYEWSSARTHIAGTGKSPLITPIWYNEEERKGYIEFLNLPEADEEKRRIRSALYTGRPTGTEKFIRQIAEELGIEFSLRPKGRPKK